MKNKGNKVLIGVSIVLVGVAGFFIVKSTMFNKNKPKENDGQKGSNSIDNSTNSSTTLSEASGLSFPIKKGSKSDDIKVVQQLIMQYDKRLLPVYKDDGKWGIETQTALQKIIKKSSIDSQADLDKITQAGVAKAGVLLSGFKLF